MSGGSFFQRLKEGLTKSRDNWSEKITAIFQNRSWDEESLNRMEETLIAADLGAGASRKLMDTLRRHPPKGDGELAEEMTARLQTAIAEMLRKNGSHAEPGALSARPWVILFLGVNGVGKTTTIGKLAAQYRNEGKKVLMVAADTFRAAAIEQLQTWGERTGTPVIARERGADAAAVAHEAVETAKREGTDVLLIDTAGRLHTKVNLMAELDKVHRVIGRQLPGAPHEVLMTVDATTGQNGLRQAKMFQEVAGLTGIILTKLDGTAKGGIALAIANEVGVPIKMISVGEKVEDLHPFDAREFAEAMFGDL